MIRSRRDLLHQLAVACELEHGLSLQYLFTAFSLADGFEEGGIHTTEQLTRVREWKANIFLVAAQEMLHLTQAANLCVAAGGTVQLRRPNFPQPTNYYPTGLPWRLDPFCADVIRRYVYYERAAQIDPSFDCAPTIPRATQDELDTLDPFRHLPRALRGQRPRQVEHATIGQLYDAIRDGFSSLPNVIIGPPRAQIDGELVDMPQLIQVVSRDDAIAGIELIVSQGEGTTTNHIDSHYGVFSTIHDEYCALVAKDPDFDPVRPVASNPLSRLHADNTCPGWRLIDDPYTRAVNDLFSSVYETSLLMLYRFFATVEEQRAELRTMAKTFLRVMTTVIEPVGEALTLLPMGPATPGKTAGPSFELPRDVQLLPHKRSAWLYLHERLLDNRDRAATLAEHDATSASVRARLHNAAIVLDQLATLFATHIPRPHP